MSSYKEAQIKVKLNPILEGIRGQVGDRVFERYSGEVMISCKADPTSKPPSKAQTAHCERFREAMLYGKLVMADPEQSALYKETAAAKGKPVFSLMIADVFNAPSVMRWM